MPRLSPWFALLALGCSDLTMPLSDGTQVAALATPPAPAAPPKTAEPAPDRPKPRVIEQKDERISASHILIAFKGSRRAKAEVTRSKQEAKKRAEEVRAKALKGQDFAALAKQYSDGPSAGKGGDLGAFGRNSMVKPFADAAFDLKVGGISNVVETEFGFHVIKRTK